MRRLVFLVLFAFSVLGMARSGPRVLRSVPEEGATGVDPGAPVTITFSEAMDPSTLNRESAEIAYADKNLRFFRDPFLGTSYSYDEKNRALTIKPPHLLPGRQILVLINSKARSFSGAPLAGAQDVRFRLSFWTKEAN